MKRILFAAFAFTAATLLSCTSDSNNNQQDAATTNPEEQTTTAATDTTLTEDKKELMQTIAQHTLLEIELGKLAVAKGSTENVKQYGQQTIDNYTNQLNELQEIARGYKVDLNVTLEDTYRKYAEDLGKKQGVDFDKEYWKNVTDAQKKALNEYEKQLKEVTEADGTAFGIWARTSEKELRARYEQALAHQLELKNRT